MSDFHFLLPDECIAHEPARPRDSARLLHVGRDTVADATVRELPNLLRAGDCLVVNDTRVIPAQLSARRGDARFAVTLDRPGADGAWHALARGAKRLRADDRLDMGDGALTATVRGRTGDGGVLLTFEQHGEEFAAGLAACGALALPPYIARPDGPTARDADDYQTVFAREPGAVAAPTAALHFTPALLAALDARGVRRATVTLHVGAGTFLPVRDDLDSHRMHAERGIVTQAAAAAINDARRDGGRIVAVGTTSLRLIETAAHDDGTVGAFEGDTDLFIQPGFNFRVADLLMTNFHLPRSTLFVLVCAFAGTQRMHAAYAHAITEKYRFFSYGDSSLLERAA